MIDAGLVVRLFMKTNRLPAVIAFLLASLSSYAGPIALNIGGSPQPANSGQGTIEAWMLGLVTTYNAAPSPDLPAPGVEAFRVNKGDIPPLGFPSFGNDALSISIPTGVYQYVALHWGGQGGGVYQAYYIGDFGTDTSYTFNAPGQNGLSWYDGFLLIENPPPGPKVPDSGASLSLLGIALAALLPLRRFLTR